MMITISQIITMVSEALYKYLKVCQTLDVYIFVYKHKYS